MNVRRWLAATCCVPLLALAACSEDEPSAEPDDPASTSSSPDPTASAGEPPAAERSVRSAKQFVSYWVDAFNAAVATGNVSQLSEVSDPNCGACSDFVKTINGIYGPGGRIESDGWKPQRFGDARLTNGDAAEVELELKLSPEVIYRTAEAEPERTTGGTGHAHFTLRWIAGGWVVSGLAQEPA